MSRGDKTPRFRTEEYWKKYRRNYQKQRRFRNRPQNIDKWLKKSRFMDGFWEVAGRFFHVRSQLYGINKFGADWCKQDSLNLAIHYGNSRRIEDPVRHQRDLKNLKLALITTKVKNASEKNRI